MLAVIIGWVLKSAIGRVVGAALGAIILSGLLYAAYQVRSYIKAKEEVRQYQRADEIRKEDKKIEKNIEGKKQEVGEFSSPDDFKRGFDELRDYRANE